MSQESLVGIEKGGIEGILGFLVDSVEPPYDLIMDGTPEVGA